MRSEDAGAWCLSSWEDDPFGISCTSNGPYGDKAKHQAPASTSFHWEVFEERGKRTVILRCAQDLASRPEILRCAQDDRPDECLPKHLPVKGIHLTPPTVPTVMGRPFRSVAVFGHQKSFGSPVRKSPDQFYHSLPLSFISPQLLLPGSSVLSRPESRHPVCGPGAYAILFASNTR